VPSDAFTSCCACGGGATPQDADDEDLGLLDAVSSLLSEETEHMWWVASGPCTMDAQGCIMSGNYPSNYGQWEQCQIAVDKNRAKPIHVQSFATERTYDVIKVNGEFFSGTRSPNGIIPTSTIFWGTDSQDEKQGWKICPRGEAQQNKPGVAILKTFGISLLVVFCSCCGAFACLWIHLYRNAPHGDGLGAGPTKIGKQRQYDKQEDA